MLACTALDAPAVYVHGRLLDPADLFDDRLRDVHDDAQVLEIANSYGALLLTSDKDFGELVFRQGLLHAGVVLYRLAGLASERKAGLLLSVLQTHGDALRGAFTLVSPTQVRIRTRLSDSP